MSFLTTWYTTDLPKEVIEILEEDIKKFDPIAQESKLHGDAVDKVIRDSKNAWIPTSHWVGGFIWHYIQRTNRENFLYDLTAIDGESIQYTQYGAGQFYDWHIDAVLILLTNPNKSSVQAPTSHKTLYTFRVSM